MERMPHYSHVGATAYEANGNGVFDREPDAMLTGVNIDVRSSPRQRASKLLVAHEEVWANVAIDDENGDALQPFRQKLQQQHEKNRAELLKGARHRLFDFDDRAGSRTPFLTKASQVVVRLVFRVNLR